MCAQVVYHDEQFKGTTAETLIVPPDRASGINYF